MTTKNQTTEKGINKTEGKTIKTLKTPELENKEITIILNKINSGKLNYFTLTLNGKIPSQESILPPHEGDKDYNYRHHFNPTDLTELGKTFPLIFPYEQTKEKTGKNLTPNSYESLMKENIIRTILDGGFNREMNYKGTNTKIKFTWTGTKPNDLLIENLKTIPEKKDKTKEPELQTI